MILDLECSEFRDPIHGFITVYEHEKEIISTPEFQRLRRIRQLGLTSYVYHGAEHSRFGHSLGVMHLAGEATGLIFAKNRELLTNTLSGGNEWNLMLRRLYSAARLAGLLHDIGHAPFSHSGEARLFPEGQGHEDYSVRIIRHSSIAAIIDEHSQETGVSSEDIVNILSKEGIYDVTFIKELISSPWDVDKMDYLLRDSLYCGVEYGKFDLRRLIDTLTLDNGYQDGSLRLAVNVDGMHTIEALLFARYFMFTQVYFHDVRRAFDIVLAEFIASCLQNQYNEATYPSPNQIEEYLLWDDYRVLTKASELADGDQRNLAWRIMQRKHPKQVYSSLPHPSTVEQRRVETLRRECMNRFGECKFWLDRAVEHPEAFRSHDIPIMEGGEVRTSLAKDSAVLQGLKEIGQFRIYADITDEEKQQEIAAFCAEFMR